jgi:IstB-like ATP binding protein
MAQPCRGACRWPARGAPDALRQAEAADCRWTRLPAVRAGCRTSVIPQLVSRRYKRGAMLVTSNRAVGEWGTVFGDPVVTTAILDRLLHHSHVLTIQGEQLSASRRAPPQASAKALWRFRQRLHDQCNGGQFLLTPRGQFRMSLDRRAIPYRQTPQPAITTPSLA